MWRQAMVGVFNVNAKHAVCMLCVGMLTFDLVLGTAHLVSHRGFLKPFLWPFHHRHHTQHHNSPAVKFCGEPYDLEVFLTQCLYALLPRMLGLDVLCGTLLVDLFGIELLIEHTGYSIFYVSQFHEAHHRYGSVAFYHFPVFEMLFGKMPTAMQIRDLNLDLKEAKRRSYARLRVEDLHVEQERIKAESNPMAELKRRSERASRTVEYLLQSKEEHDIHADSFSAAALGTIFTMRLAAMRDKRDEHVD
mmetsp:Transcript_39279/g.127120  ORF Transcript_39279/g.127120 Transcript_39279/m.127120 type:complete len:248 (+) Transcript_39279:564-1307(+)